MLDDVGLPRSGPGCVELFGFLQEQFFMLRRDGVLLERLRWTAR